jgi:NDP-sugar pyrophosphorylase family protein
MLRAMPLTKNLPKPLLKIISGNPSSKLLLKNQVQNLCAAITKKVMLQAHGPETTAEKTLK